MKSRPAFSRLGSVVVFFIISLSVVIVVQYIRKVNVPYQTTKASRTKILISEIYKQIAVLESKNSHVLNTLGITEMTDSIEINRIVRAVIDNIPKTVSDQLEGEMLGSESRDAFGRPLRFKISPKNGVRSTCDSAFEGLKIWSIGENGEDEDGYGDDI